MLSQWQTMWHKCSIQHLTWVRTLQLFLLIQPVQLLLHSTYQFHHNPTLPSLNHKLHPHCAHNCIKNKIFLTQISPKHHQTEPNPHLTHHNMVCPPIFGHLPNTTSFHLFPSHKHLHPTHTSLHSTANPILLPIQPTNEPTLPPNSGHTHILVGLNPYQTTLPITKPHLQTKTLTMDLPNHSAKASSWNSPNLREKILLDD
jgi:hypothetical protein